MWSEIYNTNYRCTLYVTITLFFLSLCYSCYYQQAVIDPPYAFWYPEDAIHFTSPKSGIDIALYSLHDSLRIDISGVLRIEHINQDTILMIGLVIDIWSKVPLKNMQIRPESSNIWYNDILLEYVSSYQEDFKIKNQQVITISHTRDLNAFENMVPQYPNITIDLTRFIGYESKSIIKDTIYADKKIPLHRKTR